MNLALSQRLPRHVRSFALDLNTPLVVGGLLAIFLVGSAVLAPLLAPFDPTDSPAFRIGGVVSVRPPLAPGTEGFLLGTDGQGRDMLSRLLYGARYTLAMCGLIALFRLTIGTVIGMFGGWMGRGQRLFSILTSVSSAVPGVFFAFIAIPVIAATGVGNLAPTKALSDAVVFTIALSLTGWAETAVRCRMATQGLRAQPFVESAYAVGQHNWGVLFRHILPNLRSVLLIEIAAAMAAALLVVAELGFFSMFIGGSMSDVFESKYPDPITAEWASMFAKGLRQRSMGSWLVVEPLLAFTLSILAFTLLSEGLRRRRR